MANQANKQIAQRHARQPADQQRLIVDQRANIERVKPCQALATLIYAQIYRELEQQQKQRRGAEGLPEDALRHQPHVAVSRHITSGGKHPVATPAEHQRNDKMEDPCDGFKQPNRRVIADKQG